jgi:hypothetical protein
VVVSSGPVARAAAEYFAGLVRSLGAQGQVKSSQGQVKSSSVYTACSQWCADTWLHAKFPGPFCRMDFCYFAYPVSRGFAYVRFRCVMPA